MPDVLVFDIETVPDPELVLEPRTDALPKIPFNRVVLIGAATLAVAPGIAPGIAPGSSPGEAYRFGGLRVLAGPEPEILAEFWRLAEGMKLVSFNGRHFDLPVLEARSLRHGLALPWYFAKRSVRDDPALHLDLLEFLSNGEPRNRARLDDYCKLVGLPGKMGIDGAQVAALFADQRVEELSAYCATDVLQTLGLFLRVQRLRGACQPASFPQMLRGMRDAIGRRIEEHAGIERERLQAFLAQSEPFWAAI